MYDIVMVKQVISSCNFISK